MPRLTLLLTALLLATATMAQTQPDNAAPRDSVQAKPAKTYPAPYGQYANPRPTLALKTNLLYHLAAVAPNVAIEWPLDSIGRMTMEAEYLQPWWIWAHNSYALQGQHIGLQMKVYLGNRHRHRRFYGHYLALHLAAGYYDLQRKGKGYQGEYLMGGINWGVVFSIGKNIALDLGLGAGLLPTRYRYYENDDKDNLQMWKRDGNLLWKGPTNAHISFVWTPVF